MRREDIADLTAFVAVAEEGSFTKAATRLGISQSALSQIVRRLEDRLGLRLLARTTRSVAPTPAGERLVRKLSPLLREIDSDLAELSEFRDTPTGNIRITSVEHAAKTILVPVLAELLPDYPEVTAEIIVDYGLVDVVADRFDAGVRLGEQVAKDMISVRISPDIPMAIVGAPAYLARHPMPKTPEDLVEHRAINLRLPSSDTINAWRLSRKGEDKRVRVESALSFNTLDLIRESALLGQGLAYVPWDQVEDDLARGRLNQVLADWTPPLPGYHLYYPNRRHSSPAFRLVVDALKARMRKLG